MRGRRAAVATGVGLVLVPTVFTMFPELAQRPMWVRVPLILLWILAASIVVIGTRRHSENVEEIVGRPRERQQLQRKAAGYIILQQLLTAEHGPLEKYEFRVFIYDADRGRLMASYEPGGVQPSEGWEIGQGAVGAAYKNEDYLCVKGEDCWNGSYGLTPEQQTRYKALGLQIVAAMPIMNARKEVIGILAASSDSTGDYIASMNGYKIHHELADAVGRVLIDVLRVARD